MSKVTITIVYATTFYCRFDTTHTQSQNRITDIYTAYELFHTFASIATSFFPQLTSLKYFCRKLHDVYPI